MLRLSLLSRLTWYGGGTFENRHSSQSPPTVYGSGTFENRYCPVTLRHALGNDPELSSAGNFPKIRVFPPDTETSYRWHHTRVPHANTRFIIIYFYILNKHKIKKISFKRSLESYNSIKLIEICDAPIFPTIYIFLRILATLPLSSSSVERTFSTLRRIKT